MREAEKLVVSVPVEGGYTPWRQKEALLNVAPCPQSAPSRQDRRREKQRHDIRKLQVVVITRIMRN